VSCKIVVKDWIKRKDLLDLPIMLSLTSLDAVCHYFIGVSDQVRQLKLQNPIPDCQVVTVAQVFGENVWASDIEWPVVRHSRGKKR